MTRNTKIKKVKKASTKTAVKVLGIAAVSIYVAYTLINQQITLAKLDGVKEEYNAKKASALTEKQKLEDELAQAGTDEYLEHKARELGFVKPNERVFIDITKQ